MCLRAGALVTIQLAYTCVCVAWLLPFPLLAGEAAKLGCCRFCWNKRRVYRGDARRWLAGGAETRGADWLQRDRTHPAMAALWLLLAYSVSLSFSFWVIAAAAARMCTYIHIRVKYVRAVSHPHSCLSLSPLPVYSSVLLFYTRTLPSLSPSLPLSFYFFAQLVCVCVCIRAAVRTAIISEYNHCAQFCPSPFSLTGMSVCVYPSESTCVNVCACVCVCMCLSLRRCWFASGREI